MAHALTLPHRNVAPHVWSGAMMAGIGVYRRITVPSEGFSYLALLIHLGTKAGLVAQPRPQKSGHVSCR